MKIRTKLTFQFSIIVISTFFAFSVVIYVFSSNYRKNQFLTRLENKALTTAKLLFEIEQVDSVLLNIIESADQTILFREKVIIIDEQNNRIFDSKKEVTFNPDINLYEKIRKKKLIDGALDNYEYIGLLFKDGNKNYVVIAKAYDIFGYSKLNNLRNILFIGFLILILITFYLGWIYSGRALKPISKMVFQVKNLTSKNLKARLDKSKNKDELAELASTFNAMLDELETAFNIQKDFVSNASHELRTPLTVIKSQIDVALLKERNSEEYKNIMKSISDDIKYLSSITNSLLLLAQTTSNLSNYTFVSIRIDDILWKARQEVLKNYAESNISIDFKKMPNDDFDFCIKANDVLLKNAFINILENACKFSNNKTITVFIDHLNDIIEITFSDNGIGISEEDLKNIFKPFFRGNNTKNTEGTGIGLSLVKNIINIHKGKIKIESVINKGTTVTILFPTDSK